MKMPRRLICMEYAVGMGYGNVDRRVADSVGLLTGRAADGEGARGLASVRPWCGV